MENSEFLLSIFCEIFASGIYIITVLVIYIRTTHIIFPPELWHITKNIRNSTRLFLEEEKAQMTCFAIPHLKNCSEMVYGFRNLYFSLLQRNNLFSPQIKGKLFWDLHAVLENKLLPRTVSSDLYDT